MLPAKRLPMSINSLREAFLTYFQKKGHTHVPSSSVVPHDDPTLLFCNAGMNQFKDVFLGTSKRDYTRAVTSQKCIRVGGKHNDLENVGHTTRHMTFFEMLGNFSFGDYFKKEAIQFAWDVALNAYQFPEEKIFVSVFEQDDEAYELWKAHLPESRICRIGEKDNFWTMGDTGPCGPCSEMFIDRGDTYGPARSPAEDEAGERFLEFWNLVFMQYNRTGDGAQELLATPSVDTGSGLERVAMLKAGVNSVFETDILQSLIAEIETRAKAPYKENRAAFHVIADHLRSLSFAIADGAQPGNVDRGYVLRKVLRRAVRYGKQIGFSKPFMGTLVPRLLSEMGDTYHELRKAQTRIEELLTLEEESFFRTLKKGGNMLQGIIENAEGTISGEDAFRLKDTYGMPFDEILLVAKDNDLSVDEHTYNKLEQEAKEKSRSARSSTTQEVSSGVFEALKERIGETTFVGHDEYETNASITAILVDGKEVEEVEGESEAILFVDQTPFYPEKGGQVGDTGTIKTPSLLFHVKDTKEPYPGLIAHYGVLQNGTLLEGDPVTMEIDAERRLSIMRNHTATHLLQNALIEVLGDQITQAGSLVEADRLRFDFTYHKSLTTEELLQVEQIVNKRIIENVDVYSEELPYVTVQKRPEIKQFFGDKYGTTVRLVTAGDFSFELCGGTHVSNTGSIGLCKITKESSIAKGVRRIEATTGYHAYTFMSMQEQQLMQMADRLGVPMAKLGDAFNHLTEEVATLKTEYKKLKDKLLLADLETLLANKQPIGNHTFLVEEIDCEPKDLAAIANKLIESVDGLLIACRSEDKCNVLIRLSQPLIGKGLKAGDLIKAIAPHIQGGGGGKPDSAQAGGKNPSGIPQAMKTFMETVEATC